MDPSAPANSGIPFRNVRVNYSDSKDTTAMHSLGDLYVITDDNGTGGTLVAPYRPFQFVDTTSPKVTSTTNSNTNSNNDTDSLTTAAVAGREYDRQVQLAKDAELKRSKVLADNALKEMLNVGCAAVSPYLLKYTVHSRLCDACGRNYSDFEAEGNGNCCQRCVCCPDCHTVLEPFMDANGAYMQCRNCLWRSAPQKDVTELTTHLTDLRLWGGAHETLLRRAAATVRRSLRENEKEISVSNEVLAERDRALGLGLVGTVAYNGSTTNLMSAAGILASTTTSGGGGGISTQNSPSRAAAAAGAAGFMNDSDSNSGAVADAPHNQSLSGAPGGSTSAGHGDSASTANENDPNNHTGVITEIKKTSQRAKRVLDFDAKLAEKTASMMASRATNFAPQNPPSEWYLSSAQQQQGRSVAGVNLTSSSAHPADSHDAFNATNSSGNAGGLNNTRNGNNNKQGGAIMSIADIAANEDADDWFDGPRPAPAWSAAVCATKSGAATNVSGQNTVQHATLATKTLMNADTAVYSANPNTKNPASATTAVVAPHFASVVAGSSQHMIRQNDSVGRTRWIRHAPLASRHAIVHPITGNYVYTPTPKDILDGPSLSSYISAKRNDSLIGNTNAGRLLPWLRVASTQFSDTFKQQHNDVLKRRIFCYLWNYGETDIKITNVKVVGTNGCGAVCSIEAAVRARAMKEIEQQLDGTNSVSGGNLSAHNSSRFDGSVAGLASTAMGSTLESTVNAISAATADGNAALLDASPESPPHRTRDPHDISMTSSPSQPASEAVFRHARQDTAEGLGDVVAAVAAVASATATPPPDNAADYASPPPPANRSQTTPAPSPSPPAPVARAHTGIPVPGLLHTSPSSTFALFLESRDRDIESLGACNVVNDKQAAEFLTANNNNQSPCFYRCDVSKALFYIDVDVIPGSELATKMVALQVTANPTVGSKRTKLSIQYNAYVTFE